MLAVFGIACALCGAATTRDFPEQQKQPASEEKTALGAGIIGGPLRTVASKPGEWNSDPRDRWAFNPAQRYPVPTEGIDAALVQTPVDAFLLQKLGEKELKPAPSADRATLLRRVTFDLTGLPPTPAEMTAALGDPSLDWFEKVVDRLLASPRYGERWGRHWLDVVRYADTSGYSNDYERPNAWRYRDYVIHSFNTDKPYDRFIIEQIAGDELQPDDPEMLVAAGYLRMGPWEHTGMSVAAVTRQLFLDDVTENAGLTFLGLSVGCARCHDHKFDPIPTKDYYRLQAVFAPVQFEERPASFLKSENTTGFELATARLNERIKVNKARLQEIDDKAKKAVNALLQKHNAKTIADLPAELRPDRWYGLDAGDQERQRLYRKRLEYYDRELNRYQPLAYSVSSGGLKKKVPTPDVHILVGGALNSPDEKVTPGVLRVVHGLKNTAIPETTEGRRLALAKWIASPEHPLTARVMVNRVWQHHFGKGLVETSNNFGKMGKRPTHPELLDWLTQYFVEHRWSVKELHRLILRSAAYQRSTEHPELEKVRHVDPENKLLAVFAPRRLTAEELRDSILAASGELSATMGGPGVFPKINPEVALQPRQIMGTLAPIYEPSPTREQRNRRTIYTFQMRSLPNPLLEVFNIPIMNTSCERRDQSTVTPQVFALFNSRFTHDMALAMAKRLEDLSKNRDEQIEQTYRLALSRRPTAKELALCRAHVEKMIEHHRRFAPVREERPKKLVRSHVGELTGKRFEFVEDWDLENYEYNLHPADVSAETRALAELCLVLLNCNEFIYVY